LKLPCRLVDFLQVRLLFSQNIRKTHGNAFDIESGEEHAAETFCFVVPQLLADLVGEVLCVREQLRASSVRHPACPDLTRDSREAAADELAQLPHARPPVPLRPAKSFGVSGQRSGDLVKPL